MDADSSEDDTANYYNNNNNMFIYTAYLRQEIWRRYAFLRIFRFLS